MRSSDKAPVSYFITLDLENLTFEVVQKDLYFGKFTSSKMEVFLDGYGKGVINFDINQYGTTCFDYQLQNNELVIKYIDITPSFKFGNYATFYMDALYNTLTLKYLDVEEFSKDIFINRFITDGAIVSISNYELPTYSNNVYGRKALLDLIKIITVDGEIAIKVKNTMVDVTKVDFTKKGFYQFTITAKVAGNDVVMYYAVQIG